MEPITIALIMIAAVIASSWIVRIIPIPIPLPLIQIVLGYAIAAIGHLGVALDPHVFMFLFLPPLLFLDGWRIPKEDLNKDIGIISQLAFGLVFLTVLGIGYFIHWIIPGIALPVAFALASVISPTDPVAVSAIAAKVPFPKRMTHILEGESLFNDASGLVCLKFALVASVAALAVNESGEVTETSFSLSVAAIDFIKMVIGGLAVGFLTTWLISRLKLWISRRWGEETGTQILISLLIPFLAYMIAENFHFSGVLAAVAAGITMSYSEIRAQVMAVTRIRRGAVWDSIQILANGATFVLLGEQLPQLVEKMPQIVMHTGHENPSWLLLYIVIITLALLVVRWLWVWATFKLSMRLKESARLLKEQTQKTDAADISPKTIWVNFQQFIKSIKPFIEVFKKTSSQKIGPRIVSAMSVAGVRGSITMAAVLTIPLSIVSRDLVIFLASGVILLTLILASVTLPWLLKDLEMPALMESESKETEDHARNIAAEAAIKAIQEAEQRMAADSEEPDLYIDTANRIMSIYRAHIEMRSYASSGDETHIPAKTVRKIEAIERQMRLIGLDAERKAIYQQARKKLVNEAVLNALIREIDLTEASIRTQ
ncbi:MAG: cation:proton antiporter [Saezia sp.]